MTQTILDVRGIGPAMQIALAKHGFVTVADLANTTVALLAVTPGITEKKATQIIADAGNLGMTVVSEENVAVTKNKDKDKKTDKNAKKDKKDKKNKKNKKDKNKKKDKDKAKKSKKKSK